MDKKILMLLELACHLRSMQLTMHHFHNVCRGPSFFADHSALGEFYSAVESDYDDVIERVIGLSSFKSVNGSEIARKAVSKLPNLDADMWAVCMQLEDQLSQIGEAVVHSGVSEGTRQMVGDILNDSEVRKFKIRQRMTK